MLFGSGAVHGYHVDWLADQLGLHHKWDIEKTQSLGVYSDELIAVVVFHDWQPEYQTICMSAAAIDPGWMSRRVIRMAHSYMFDDVGCRLAILQVSESNLRMLRIADRLGYTGTFVPELRGRDEGEYICTLRAVDWRRGKYC